VANIKSQIKRNRQNDAAHERNKSVKSALKSAVRKFREAAEAGDKEKAQELAAVASKKLDKAASAGVIHKNQAANKKSAIGKKAASLRPEPGTRRTNKAPLPCRGPAPSRFAHRLVRASCRPGDTSH
jgi:small subunit ribosomal protein S20